MAVLVAAVDAPVSTVDDRAESPAAFGSLDSGTDVMTTYLSPAWPTFALAGCVWLQPDIEVVDTQGAWAVVA